MNRVKTMQFIVLCGLYGLICHFIFTNTIRIDYSSFYSSSKALLQGDNPYQPLFTTYLPTVKKVAFNVNPPIVLMLFMPLSKMSYSASLILWSAMSIVFGLITASVCFKLAFKPAFIKQHRVSLYMIYFAFCPTVINTLIGQLGTLIAFFIIVGYYFYTRKRDFLAAIMWGTIIAMKFFPGLLFFYALIERRYKVMTIMAATIAIISIIPWLVYGTRIYSNYLTPLLHVRWYGDHWNASINGFLFRILTDGDANLIDFFLLQWLYLVFFIVGLIWYLKKIYATPLHFKKNHITFSLTLVMMLLMSPFGWVYYFPLLILPLCLTWPEASATRANKKIIFAWITCLFLFNFPVNYLPVQHVTTLVEKLTLHSFYFYGLILLAYILTTKKQTPLHASNNLVIPMQIILGFGVAIVSFELLVQFTSTMSHSS